MTLKVAPSARASWLVLGQSYNDGWTASTDTGGLGPQLLVNGYANGWQLPAHEGPLVVHLRWTPQRVVDIAVGLSAVATALVLVLAFGFFPRPRRSIDRRPWPLWPSLRPPAPPGGPGWWSAS